ncbi:Hypp1881 [Branchiostoma lanceolatum]|uniref:Hypp1881 protein n=1 Tax=Branchiostoma lanceolatum TaxID=7740 RepID=A0A8J9ZPI3_BRALA|nr:Hypp1881 [Branchiostoma lanceolatum]
MTSFPTTHDLHIYGSINGLEFDMVGGGSGNPNDGSVETRVKSTKGALPAFSPLLVGPHLGYGFYQYLPFPGGPSPYQASIKDGGYSEHRNIQFEDGAVLSATYRYTYEGGKIKGDFNLVGSGFPASSPVMTSALTGLDRSVAKMTCVDDNTLVENIDWTYRTSGGGSYRAMVQTNCTFNKPAAAGVKGSMPMFVFRQLEVTATKTEISLQEKQKAFSDVQ